jgi:hypothetical protein
MAHSDADTGVGVGTPITPVSPGTGGGVTVMQPLRTILSLPEYAAIMGINPIQFQSGKALNLFPDSGCTDRWREYAWQDEKKVSREEMRYEINQAEIDIAAELGYWPGPVWTESEEVQYPQYHRKGYVGVYGHDSNHGMKSVQLEHGKFIAGGKRISTLVEAAASVTLSDPDGDSFNELATVQVATALTNASEIKVYRPGHNGEPEWEIRPLKTATITGGNYVATFDSWLLFKEELLIAFPGPNPTGFQDIDAENIASYETTADVYRVYTDPEEMATLQWECELCGGTGCTACTFDTQTACLQGFDEETGMINVRPATYAEGPVWTFADFTKGYEPNKVRVSYLSGDYRLDNQGNYRVPHDLALAITKMATARLSRPLCHECENLRAREMELKEDLIWIQKGGDATRFVTKEVLNNPFGTKVGELEAWRIVKARIKHGDFAPAVAIV